MSLAAGTLAYASPSGSHDQLSVVSSSDGSLIETLALPGASNCYAVDVLDDGIYAVANSITRSVSTAAQTRSSLRRHCQDRCVCGPGPRNLSSRRHGSILASINI
jgi:hypothetical protein